MGDGNKHELSVRCNGCGHKWIAAYLPMQMDRMADLLSGLHCPKCAASPMNIFVCDEEVTE